MHSVIELITATSQATAGRTLGTTEGEMLRQRTFSPALSAAERQLGLDISSSKRFTDTARASVHAPLLDQGCYLSIVRTRKLRLLAHSGYPQRRNQRRRTAYAKPELLANSPNLVWSGDITKPKGPAERT